MQKRTVLVSLLASCVVFAMGAFVSAQAQTKTDPAGTWIWTSQMMNRRGPQADANTNTPPRMLTNTLVLKLEGDKLTGTLSAPAGRGGNGTPVENKIADVKVTGDDISFSVTVEGRDGNPRTTKYSGKIAGDTLKGKIESEGPNGPTSRDFEAKREKK